MGVKRLPAHLLGHRGDLPWLEKHGERARQKYIDLHESVMQEHAALAFDSVMFRDWDTGALYGVVPEWMKRKFSEGLPKLDEDFEGILPAGVGWSREPKEKRGATTGQRTAQVDPRRETVTVIEIRAGGSSGD